MNALFDLLTQFVVRALDYPLAWMLKMPRDLMIILIALATSLMMSLARKWVTNQDLLHRCDNDLARLKVLAKAAKKAKDKLARQNNAATVGMIQIVQFKAEMRALMFSIVPVALLATWAFVRVPCVAPAVGEPMLVKAYFPLSCADQLVHLLPAAGLEVADPIQLIRPDPTGGNALASWKVKPTAALENGDLCFRLGEETVHHPCKVGSVFYEPPVVEHADSAIMVTEAVLKQPSFLGILPAVPINFIPGIPKFSVDAWLVAYIVLAFVFVPLSRWLLKIY